MNKEMEVEKSFVSCVEINPYNVMTQITSKPFIPPCPLLAIVESDEYLLIEGNELLGNGTKGAVGSNELTFPIPSTMAKRKTSKTMQEGDLSPKRKALDDKTKVENGTTGVMESNELPFPIPSIPSRISVTKHERAKDLPRISAFAEVLQLATQIETLLDPQSGSTSLISGFTIENLQMLINEAEATLGFNVVYNDELMASLNLKDFKKSDCQHNDALLATKGLNEILSDNIKHHCLKGEDSRTLNAMMASKGVTDRFKTLDVLSVGARKVMVNSFVPNGGREVSNGGSYRQKRAICNDAIFELHEKNRVVIFSQDALTETGFMQELCVSPLVWTMKPDKPKGRTCLNLSKSSKGFKSYNESIDYKRSEKMYPTIALPLLQDIAEMACQQREANPGKRLAGATIDVTAAYNQCAMTRDASKLTTTKINVPDGIGGWIIFIVIYLVGIFGNATAGNVYCTCANSIDQLHNSGLPRRRSHTYIDDGLLIDTLDRIQQSAEEYIGYLESFWGKEETVNQEKVVISPDKLIGIGWEFDFISWTVQPKERGMAKLLLSVFKDIPMGATSASEKDLEKVAGVLTWYASGIPAGEKFVTSLHANKHHICPRSKRTLLSNLSQEDLQFWRALMVVGTIRPRLIAASISAVRRSPSLPSRYLVTDASSLVGGGAQVSGTRGGSELEEYKGTRPVRWTKKERMTFIELGVSINVLEYFIVIYYVMLWGESFRNMVIHIECDNTSAISWIMKNRTKCGTAADTLARIFSLFCLTYNITIICIHIRGIDNTIADFRSRDLYLASQEADEELFMDLRPHKRSGGGPSEVSAGSKGSSGRSSAKPSRAMICRRLLQVCLEERKITHGQKILTVLMDLRGTPGAPETSY